MDSKNYSIFARFEEIKQKLDPAYSYFIFEKPKAQGNGNKFEEITTTFSRFKKSVLECEVHTDETRQRILLLIKFDPNKKEQILQEFFSFKFPKDAALYFFDAENSLIRKVKKLEKTI